MGLYSSGVSRCGITVVKNTSILQILSIWAELEVFFQRVTALEWGDGTFVNLEVRFVFFDGVGHDERESRCGTSRSSDEREFGKQK